MYTLFSVIFQMLEKGDSFDNFFEKVKTFIMTYSKFRNEFQIQYEDELKNSIYEDIKKCQAFNSAIFFLLSSNVSSIFFS